MLLISPEIAVPPVTILYHRYCPLIPPAADNVNTAGIHEFASVVVGGDGNGITVAVTIVRALSQLPTGSKMLT